MLESRQLPSPSPSPSINQSINQSPPRPYHSISNHSASIRTRPEHEPKKRIQMATKSKQQEAFAHDYDVLVGGEVVVIIICDILQNFPENCLHTTCTHPNFDPWLITYLLRFASLSLSFFQSWLGQVSPGQCFHISTCG